MQHHPDPETHPTEPDPPPEPPRPAAPAAPRRGDEQPRGRGRGEDEARRRRGDRRGSSGFGDGVERAFCARYRSNPPPGFPVQHRTGATTLRVVVVARRPEAVLLCDSAHPNGHQWPDGEPVADPGAEPRSDVPNPS